MRIRWIGLILSALTLSLAACGDGGEGDATCGNGILENGEFCDDGNVTSGDGCAPDCLLERPPDGGGGGMADADPNAPDADPNAPDGDVVPPDANLNATAVINEVVPNDEGADDAEFVEIFGTPSTDFSNLTVLSVDGDTPGRINVVIPMGTTDAQGFFANTPGNLGMQNGSESFLLVDGFVGNVNDDIDANDDGTIDALTGTVIDAVAIDDGGANDRHYGGVVLPIGHPPLAGQVDGASRIPDGMDTDQPSDWVSTNTNGTQSGAADETPGAPNALVP